MPTSTWNAWGPDARARARTGRLHERGRPSGRSFLDLGEKGSRMRKETHLVFDISLSYICSPTPTAWFLSRGGALARARRWLGLWLPLRAGHLPGGELQLGGEEIRRIGRVIGRRGPSTFWAGPGREANGGKRTVTDFGRDLFLKLV